jgi:ATP-dependent Lhr-like helicase
LVAPISTTPWSANVAQQLLTRHGIVMRETAVAESIPRGYTAVYPALKTMEDSGWIRRGMFVAGMGAAQFAATSAVDMLRSLRTEPSTPEVVFLAASDPANPYGAVLPWPRGESADSCNTHSMSRTSGAGVILVNGALAAFLRRRNSALRIFLPENEPERSQHSRELAKKLAELAVRWQGHRSGLLIGEINGAAAREHCISGQLKEFGFIDTALGFQMRRVTPRVPHRDAEVAHSEENDQDISERA